MNQRGINRFIALAGLLLAGAMALNTNAFPERAAAAARYVLFLSTAMAFFSVVLLLHPLKNGGNQKIEWVRAPKYFLATVVGLLCYVLLLALLGFFAASFLFMTLTTWMLGFRDLRFLLLGTGGTLFFIYLVFVRFLQVPVPTGLFGG